MITQDLAKNAINNLGLSALGLASAQLTTRWSTGDVTFDAATLRLTTTGVWRAMASGTLHWRPLGAPELRGVDGAGLAGALAVLRLHPQTHLRLVRLYAQRFEGDANGRSLRPVPYAVAFHGVTFGYDAGVNVLDGVTFDVARGERPPRAPRTDDDAAGAARPPDRAGEAPEEGQDPGAPVRPREGARDVVLAAGHLPERH